MRNSLAQLTQAQRLSEAGHHQDLLDYLAPHEGELLHRSPTLALLYGSAHARLGRDVQAARWANAALKGARERGDRAVEARALNLLGAIALEAGRLEEAANCFMRGLAAAKHQSDNATVGRCSNNLGIIADQQGKYQQALSWYLLALAAYQQAGLDRGIAETHHNLAMTYLAEGDDKRALEQANHAVGEADRLGDTALCALALSGRAEIRALGGDAEFARREVERALKAHREAGDVVGEAQDLRILALARAGAGAAQQAETQLRDVIDRAESLGRPHLAATAGLDLARVLKNAGRPKEARKAAEVARSHFQRLGAVAQVKKLEELTAELSTTS